MNKVQKVKFKMMLLFKFYIVNNANSNLTMKMIYIFISPLIIFYYAQFANIVLIPWEKGIKILFYNLIINVSIYWGKAKSNLK